MNASTKTAKTAGAEYREQGFASTDLAVFLTVYDLFTTDEKEVAGELDAKLKISPTMVADSFSRLVKTGLIVWTEDGHGKPAVQPTITHDEQSREEADAQFQAAYPAAESEPVEFDRDAYAEAISTIEDAVLAMRNAATAARTLRDAGEQFGIQPFIDIQKNYIGAVECGYFATLEHVADGATAYYPVTEESPLAATANLGDHIDGVLKGQITGIDGSGPEAVVTVSGDKPGAEVGYPAKQITAMLATGAIWAVK